MCRVDLNFRSQSFDIHTSSHAHPLSLTPPTNTAIHAGLPFLHPIHPFQFDTDAFGRLRVKLPATAATESGETVARFTLPGAGGQTLRYAVHECLPLEAEHFVNLLPDSSAKEYKIGRPFARYFSIVADLAVPQIDQQRLASDIAERAAEARRLHETVTHGQTIGNLHVHFKPIGCAVGDVPSAGARLVV